jgi:hypothetical protein
MLKPEERRAKEFAESISGSVRELTSSVNSLREEEKDRYGECQARAAVDHIPEVMSVLGHVTQRLDTLVGEQETQSKETQRFQKTYLCIQWLLLIVTAGAFGAAAYYALLTKQQVDLLEADNRPWLRIVKVELAPSPHLPAIHFTPGLTGVKDSISAMNVSVELRIKNIGKGVAQNVFIVPVVIFEPWNQTEFTTPADERRACDYWAKSGMAGQEGITYSAIFPGDEIVARAATTGVIFERDINHLPGRPERNISSLLIGCVIYQSPHDYQTRALFQIMGPTDRFMEVGVDPDASSAHLLRDQHYEYAQ